MHLSSHPKLNAFSRKTLSAAVISAMLLLNANAAGLGKLTVLSSLGQPLHAEIELTSIGKDEAGSLAPKLASVDAFRQANIDFNPALFSLRFAIEQRAGRHFIRVTSAQPINEPFVDMLLELGGSNNRLIREYTFLLDPAELRSSQSPQVASPVVLPPAPLARRTPTPAPAEAPSAQPAEQPKAVARERGAQSAAPVARGKVAESDEYQVKAGDSLSKIAGRVKPEGISLDQMLVALYRANPEAFGGKNMNRLRAGQVLSVPSAETAGAIANGEARSVIVAQATDFNSYRNKLAGQVAVATPRTSTESAQAAAGKITTRVEEQPNAASEAKDKLKLSKSGVGKGGEKGASPAVSDEERIAKDKALAEANARVQTLEKNVADLQKILEVKNKNLAEQQKLADAGKTGSASTAPAPAAENKAPSATPVPVPAPQANASQPAAPAAATEAAPESKPEPAAKPKIKRAPPPPPEPGLTDSLMDSPFVLPGIAALAALLGGLGIYSLRRKKQSKQFEDSIITDSSLRANSLFGSTGGQSVDTSNSVFNSNFAPSVSQLDSNEVDPVAEADVYIAYGRDAQAEEILKEALRTQPDRNAVRVKLLEIYANRKDIRSFEVLATELYALTKGQGDEWAQAAALGLGIDPQNPLYASGKQAADSAPIAAAPVAAASILDEPDLDELLTPSQMNTTQTGANSIEQSSYFSNPALDADTQTSDVEQPKAVEEPKAIDSNDLDFDLEGLNLDSMDVPNTIPRPMPVEEKTNLDEINFDFLDDKSDKPQEDEIVASDSVAAAEQPMLEIPDFDMSAIDLPAQTPIKEAVAAEAAHDDFSLMLSDLPDVAEAHPAAAPEIITEAVKPEIDAMEFDLSGITLELDPNASSALVEESYGVHDTATEDYSSNAEMATKLDLAVAYQEIGDKEGARELLDEVVKGGAPEQSDKARSLLAKLA
jgi:pilus assembly protein FimV